MQTFAETYLDETTAVLAALPHADIEMAVVALRNTREWGGRVFCIGVGGSAATASHAAADLRGLCGIQAYAFDNIAGLTATANDHGWEHIFAEWLADNRLDREDCLFVFSVGGGTKKVSVCIVKALQYAQAKYADIVGIVGRNGGVTAKGATACILVPTINAERVTPHVEEAHAIILHLIVSHPALQVHKPKWESL